MRIINVQNLDEWLFNYFEGNLEEGDKETLVNFLHKNPAFKADYDAWKGSYLHEPEIIYPGMNNLLKPQGMKWLRWGLGTVIVGIIASYLFYQGEKNPETKEIQKAVPVLQETISKQNTETKNIPVIISKEKKYSKEEVSETASTIKKPTEMPASSTEALPIIQIRSIPMDSVKKEPAKRKETASSSAEKPTKTKKKTKKEMKIIKLKSTGL